MVAQANALLDDDGHFIDERVAVAPRRAVPRGAARAGRLHGRLAQADRVGGDGADPVPGARRRQPRADGLEHAAPGRAAARARGAAGRHRHGGAQPRATPARSSSPARRRGRSASTAERIVVETTTGELDDVPPRRSSCAPTRAPASTSARSSTRGQRVDAGQPLADSARPTTGELALGQNVLVRVHELGGRQLRGRDHPQRDAWSATTCSPRSTSRSTRSRPATPSSAPRRSRATSRTSARSPSSDLDENGIIRIGAEVQRGRHPGRQDHAQGRDRADRRGAAAARDLR